MAVLQTLSGVKDLVLGEKNLAKVMETYQWHTGIKIELVFNREEGDCNRWGDPLFFVPLKNNEGLIDKLEVKCGTIFKDAIMEKYLHKDMKRIIKEISDMTYGYTQDKKDDVKKKAERTKFVNFIPCSSFAHRLFENDIKLSFMVCFGKEDIFYSNRSLETDQHFISSFTYEVDKEVGSSGSQILQFSKLLANKSVTDMFRTVNRTYTPMDYVFPKSLIVLNDNHYVVVLNVMEFKNPSNKQYGSTRFKNSMMVQELNSTVYHINKYIV